jgi:energy-coupling factor transport system permease protein
MVALFAVKNLLGYLSMGACLQCWSLFLSGVPLSYLIKGLRPVLVIIIFTITLHFFLTPGTEVFRWGILKITWEGIRQGVFMGLRLVFLVLVTSLLTLTTSPISLTDGLGIPVEPRQKDRYSGPRTGHDDEHCLKIHPHSSGRNGKNHEGPDGSWSRF